MDAHVTSSPGRRRAAARLAAWAGMLAMVLQLAAPLTGAARAQLFADDPMGHALASVICTSAETGLHGPAGSGPQDPDAPFDHALPCTLCFVCQAGALGARLAASAPLPAPPSLRPARFEAEQGAFDRTGQSGKRPPTRAPPFIA